MKNLRVPLFSKRFVVLSILFILLLAGVLVPTHSASAGWNGQQIYIESADANVKATSLHIEACDQNCNWATYNRYIGFPGASSYYVNNMWWMADTYIAIGISVTNPGYSTTIECWTSVPKSQLGDWVRIKFNRYGCWRG